MITTGPDPCLGAGVLGVWHVVKEVTFCFTSRDDEVALGHEYLCCGSSSVGSRCVVIENTSMVSLCWSQSVARVVQQDRSKAKTKEQSAL